MTWDCAICGKQHEHWPDLARDVHFPTRESAVKMGFKIEPKQKPPAVDDGLLSEMLNAAAASKQRALKCSGLGLNDLAGCWTRCQADLEATVRNRRKYDALPDRPGPQWGTTPPRRSLADQTEGQFIDKGEPSKDVEKVPNLFTGELEAPHEPVKRKRGRK